MTDTSADRIENKEQSSYFQCNICNNVASNPVVTPCGHLFCWRCIYHWLKSNQEFLACPTCNDGIEISKLTPVFNKIHDEDIQSDLPQRPQPKRYQQVPNPAAIGSGLPNTVLNAGSNIHKGVLLAGFGLFPSLSVLLFQSGNNIDTQIQQQPSPQKSLQCLCKTTLFLVILIFIIIIIFCCLIFLR